MPNTWLHKEKPRKGNPEAGAEQLEHTWRARHFPAVL